MPARRSLLPSVALAQEGGVGGRYLSSVVPPCGAKDGCEKLEAMPAIAAIEDLKAAQKGFTLCSFTDTRHETRSRY